ncbi:hypothetical protein [uncultured Psychroserpens sp.]|uniref:hypothetical protein n=1 Tax=uncultured Psychroserpens sp. TaxID=255436 RepID=UPI00260FAB00|nr:hypothetical protein [uncultured Psychroserpens sp.]
MTSGLRKAHKFIWLLLIITVPIIMFFSVKDLEFFTDKQAKEMSFELGDYRIVATDENEVLKAAILKNEDSIKIDIEIKTPLKASSAEVYELNQNKEKGRFLGPMSKAKTYSFYLNNDATGILVFDTLKGTEITKLIF